MLSKYSSKLILNVLKVTEDNLNIKIQEYRIQKLIEIIENIEEIKFDGKIIKFNTMEIDNIINQDYIYSIYEELRWIYDLNSLKNGGGISKIVKSTILKMIKSIDNHSLFYKRKNYKRNDIITTAGTYEATI